MPINSPPYGATERRGTQPRGFQLTIESPTSTSRRAIAAAPLHRHSAGNGSTWLPPASPVAHRARLSPRA